MGKIKSEIDNNLISDKTVDTGKAASILGISTATVKNWARLGKLNPVSASPLLFLEKDIYSLHDRLDELDLLNKRRNKSRAAGNFVPGSYIDKASPNYSTIRKIMDSLLGESYDMIAVIFCYAKELMAEKNIPQKLMDSLLPSASREAMKKFEKSNIFKTCSLRFIQGEDTLGLLYLSLRNLREKKSTGSYYTPFFVADRLLFEVFGEKETSQLSICDPSCGTGNFLLRLPKDVYLENIYGYDIDDTAISIARINLALKFSIKTKEELDTITSNLRVRNFLLDNDKENSAFDIILGNPPWGYVFSESEISALKGNYSSLKGNKNPESFSLFTERGLSHLNKYGHLCYLLPETILGSDTHLEIRRIIMENAELRSLVYLGDVFDKVQCPSVILLLGKSSSCEALSQDKIKVAFDEFRKNKVTSNRSFTVNKNRLGADSFHLLANDREAELIKKILSVPHFTLKGNAEFALGIVTGSNKTLIKHSPGEGLEPIITGTDIEKYGLKKSENYVHFDPKTFQQCAPIRLYRAKEKLFYRFIAGEPMLALDTEGRVSLNSANVIVPHVEDYSAAYIMAILNSQVISFFYKKSFKNMKVLRSYLEMLPIAFCDEAIKKAIERDADNLSGTDRNDAEFEKLRKNIDKRIYKLYGLSEDEINLIKS